jgi:hypothetical protein
MVEHGWLIVSEAKTVANGITLRRLLQRRTSLTSPAGASEVGEIYSAVLALG